MRSLGLLACLAACAFESPKATSDAGAGAGSTWVVVEELAIPTNSPTATVTSKLVLQAEGRYRLRASGVFDIGPGGSADAEYFGFDGGAPQDGVLNLDIGLAVNDPIVDATRTPEWGPYAMSHVYEIEWRGDGRPIVAQLHDNNYTNNQGVLMLAILALQ